MNTKKNHTITAIILSGGKGSRLGGVDKGLKVHNGKALVAWVIEAVTPQVGTIVISINRNNEHYKKFNLATVFDEGDDEFSGPIAGITSCANALKDSYANKQEIEYYLIASCDSPNLTQNYVEKLLSTLEESDFDVAVVNDGQRNQNLHCLIKSNSIEGLQHYFHAGGRSMFGWLQQSNVVEVDFSNQAEAFVNVNTQNDLDHSNG